MKINFSSKRKRKLEIFLMKTRNHDINTIKPRNESLRHKTKVLTVYKANVQIQFEAL